MSTPHNAERISVLYFQNAVGYVIIAPDRSHPCPDGFEKRYCTTLAEIDSLTRKLNRQDTDMFSRMQQKDRAILAARHGQIKAKLGQRLLAVDCTRMERLFIHRMFQYLEKKEAELLKCEVRGYFHQREYDSAGSDPVDKYGTQLKMPKMSDRLASVMSSK